MINWPQTPLREVTTKIGSGATPRGGKGVYQDSGVALIRSQNVYDHRFDATGIARITDQAAHALAGVTVHARDVLVNITGESVTRTCSVDPNVLPARVSQHVAIIRARTDRLDPAFLRYSLLNPPIKEYLNTISKAGATRRALTKADLEGLEIALPPLLEQRLIVGVLGAFDDLVEKDRTLARSQETLARALASRGGDDVALQEIAWVPKVRQRRPAGLVDHFSIPAFDDGLLPAHDLGSTILSGKYVLSQPSVLVSRLNPSTPRTWMAYPGTNEAVCSPEFVVLTGRYGVSTEEVWAVTSSDDFWKQMQSSVGGTTNSRQRVDKAAVPELIVPDVRLLSAEERAAISTLVRGAYELRVEAAELAAHRDELLPLLMSGKVRVSEVEGVA